MDVVVFSFEQLQLGSTKYFLKQAQKNKEDVPKYWAFCSSGILNAAILLEVYVSWFAELKIDDSILDPFKKTRRGFKAKWNFLHKEFREEHDPKTALLPHYDDKELENIRKTIETRNTIVHYTIESIANLLSEEQLELAIQSIYELQKILGKYDDFFINRPNDYSI